MASVLVAGGLGHLGLYTAREIARRGDRAIVFDIACTATNAEQRGDGWGNAVSASDTAYWLSPEARHILGDKVGDIVVVRGNVLNMSELIDVLRRYEVTRIVNAAGVFNPVISFQNPMEAFRSNVETSVCLFEAARVLGIGRLVHMSTVAVYAEVRSEPVDETYPLYDISAGSPSGPHGAVKAASEVMGMTYYSAYGLDYIALRLTAVYGFGMRLPMHVAPMVEASVRGEECVFPKGDMRRDYIYIDDAVRGVITALYTDAPLTQRVFIIGSGVITSTSVLAETVRNAIPGARITISGGMSDLETSNLRMRGQLDISAARDQLGFSPAYDMSRGVRAYADELRRFRDKH